MIDHTKDEPRIFKPLVDALAFTEMDPNLVRHFLYSGTYNAPERSAFSTATHKNVQYKISHGEQFINVPTVNSEFDQGRAKNFVQSIGEIAAVGELWPQDRRITGESVLKRLSDAVLAISSSDTDYIRKFCNAADAHTVCFYSIKK